VEPGILYYLGKLAGSLFSPFGLALFLLAVGAFSRWRGFRRSARAALLTAPVLLYLLAVPPVADLLLGSLEQRFPSLESPPVGTRFVVVLGSAYGPRPGIATTSALDEQGLLRLVEGLRLVRQIPGARLVVSGGAPRGQPTPARGYARLAHELGMEVAPGDILERGFDTSNEARELAVRFRVQPCILVTSAYHMPRAMALMRRAQVQAIAAPAGFRAGNVSLLNWRSFWPSARNLQKSEAAMHEYLAFAALALGVE
jgi:uncharacterized SAM-binding protein YcdF (DUF218 family)